MREKRKYPRRRLHPPVAFRTEDGPRVEASCENISLGGMFIRTDARLRFGQTVQVFLTLPGMRREATILSRVQWVSPQGIGVQFGLMGARETHALTELLAAPKSDLPQASA